MNIKEFGKKLAMRIIKWFFLINRWSVLRTIGASYLSTLSIAVPFLGYFIFFGSFQGTTYTLDFMSLSTKIHIPESDAFIRLKLTYVGLSMVGFSTMIYKMFCPREVAIYKSMREYIQASLEITFPAHAVKIRDEILKGKWYNFALEKPLSSAREDIQLAHTDGTIATKMRSGGKARSLERTEWIESNQNSLNYIFSKRYEQADASVVGARYIIFSGYVGGFVFLLIPSVTVFIPQLFAVSEYIVRFF